MLKLKKFDSSNIGLYNYMKKIMVESFPKNEYRSFDELKNYSEKRVEFINNIIINDAIKVGFISYWEFSDFYYFEHIAIDKKYRNLGIGSRLLEHLSKILDKTIILEVEPEITVEAIKRIAFYKKNGFKLLNRKYYQPPLNKGDKPFELKLMILEKNSINIDNTILKMYEIVYKQKE